MPAKHPRAERPGTAALGLILARHNLYQYLLNYRTAPGQHTPERDEINSGVREIGLLYFFDRAKFLKVNPCGLEEGYEAVEGKVFVVNHMAPALAELKRLRYAL